MTRSEAVAFAESFGLQLPRIIPHKDRAGEVVWNLHYGPTDDRRTVVLPVEVDKKRLEQAVKQCRPTVPAE